MEIIINIIPHLLVIVGALVILTNIIVEVLKKLLWDKLPTNILAVVVSLVLTMVTFFAVAAYMEIVILWYYVAAAIVVAFMVAYAAMFGYDKLKEALCKFKELKI